MRFFISCARRTDDVKAEKPTERESRERKERVRQRRKRARKENADGQRARRRRFVLRNEIADFNDRAKERGEFVERNHVGTVARGRVRIEMRFEKERVDSDRRRRASEGADEFAFASGDASRRARFLNAVRRVENDRRAGLTHDRKGTEIVDKRAVSEKRSAFAE